MTVKPKLSPWMMMTLCGIWETLWLVLQDFRRAQEPAMMPESVDDDDVDDDGDDNDSLCASSCALSSV